MNKTWPGIIAAGATALMLAGCGSFASSHDNAAVNYEIKNGQVLTIAGGSGGVTRIDTPGNFPAVVRICIGPEGIYVAGDGGSSTFVVPYDPGCGWKGSTTGPATP